MFIQATFSSNIVHPAVKAFNLTEKFYLIYKHLSSKSRSFFPDLKVISAARRK